ncbi:prolyl oligopeptidase family serine peptidase [Flavobacterium sp. Sd200]|uniref:acetylxylan esterase n=1 Tax=Flavobacterium sp. Sd200 TaxID=2692211 RepID=UPI001369DF65|nr:acetylxylan esterase [Flavobacterium sp. Sd200]MXN90853.1 prolyl oligopeptidase family serine peptidase [Flavobacterium sp. Sd200]
MKKILLFLILLLTNCIAIAQTNSDVLWVTTPGSTNWVYKVNEEAKVTIQFYRYGIPQDIEIKYSIGPELLKATKEGKIKLVKGKAELSLGTLNKPGFVDCRLTAEIEGQQYKHHVKVGFDPEKIEPYTKYPNDFNEFWSKAKEEAALCPMKVEKVFKPEFSTDKVDCYLVKVQAYKEDVNIYGYLTIPKKPGKYPVVFTPPGAGIHVVDPSNPTSMAYAENGLIRFETEIHGIRPDLDAKTYKEIARAFSGGDNGYLVNGIEDRDKYYMKKVYLSCVRAIDYITSLPEWDGKNVIAQGGSQGGALALVTAGLDPRVTVCAASYPALSDMVGYLHDRAGGYPHMFKELKGMDKPEIIKTLEYYDVVNFAKQIKVPVFMTWGFNDNTCPPTTSYAAYNVIKASKTALITPVNEHWSSDNTKIKILNWIKTQLK